MLSPSICNMSCPSSTRSASSWTSIASPSSTRSSNAGWYLVWYHKHCIGRATAVKLLDSLPVSSPPIGLFLLAVKNSCCRGSAFFRQNQDCDIAWLLELCSPVLAHWHMKAFWICADLGFRQKLLHCALSNLPCCEWNAWLAALHAPSALLICYAQNRPQLFVATFCDLLCKSQLSLLCRCCASVKSRH